MTLYTRWFALAALVTGSLSASVPDQAGTGAADRNLMFSSLPPEPKCPEEPKCPPRRKCDGGAHRTNAEFSSPRERKEWRELSPTEIDKYACALKEMDQHTTKELRECYGETAWSFPDLVSLHACAAADPRGDQGHRTPGFMLFHKSYVLTFEEALLAVDPSIGATPWWNMALDSAPVLNLNGTVKVAAGELYCPTLSNPNMTYGSKNDDPKRANLDMGYPERHCDPEKYIWSCNYFGEMHGSGPNFEVTNGRWAYRTMARWGDFDTTYWSRDENKKVNNECIVNRYFTPQSAMPTPDTALRKNPSFYNLTSLTHDQLNQNCVRCCDAYKHGTDVNCTCDRPDDLVDIYMRGPTLDTQTCSPYVTRNPNGRGIGKLEDALEDGNGRSQQDSLIRYTQHDFDACADSHNTRNWIEWQNCQEENEFGTLEGVYCPAGKETCKQSELEKVYALHSTGHDKTLGEIGDVTTSPSDPALFFSYHAYIDKNFMEWQTSMKKEGRFVDHHQRELLDQKPPGPGLSADDFGYPRQVTFEEWNDTVTKFEDVPLVKDLIWNSNQRMELRGYVKPVEDFRNFDLQQWIDLLGLKSPNAHQFPNKSFSTRWHEEATGTQEDYIAIYNAHAGHVRSDEDGFKKFFNTLTAAEVYPDFLGPACSSAANNPNGNTSDNTAEPIFNPIFSSKCIQPTFPSPQEGSLTYKLTNGARTYSSSGPFIYMTSYRPTDFFVRGSLADPTLPWVPGTLLKDFALGGLPFRNLFPTDDGREFGYTNKDIIELSLPCFPGRSPDNVAAPCAQIGRASCRERV